jgi:hypothetical protein
MTRRGVRGWWLWGAVVMILLLGLAACSGGSDDRAATIQADDLARLKQQVAAQNTRIAALEAQGALAPEVAAQATRIAALETQAVLPPPLVITPELATNMPTLVPTLAPSTPRPGPTTIPTVAGLVMDGATKGAANAKVTITEYSDYL